MFHVYYTQKGTNLYFLNKTEYEVWMNVRELDFDFVINGESEANIILLYVTDKLEWGKDELTCDNKIYVFKSLTFNLTFAVKGNQLTKKFSPLTYLDIVS